MSIEIGNVELHMGPEEVGGPDNLQKVIVDFIDGAQKRLFVAVQELDSREIAEALIRARERKVLVKLVVEGDYLLEGRALVEPFNLEGTNETNRTLYNAILRANIDAKSDYNTKIFHQKFMTRDSSALLTGSTNFTETGTSTNLNHVVVIRDEKIAKIYNREFKEIQQGHFGKLNEGHDPAPSDLLVSDIPVRILFAPDHNPEMEIMKQMLKAKKRIDFAIFTFAQSSGIDDTMIALRNANIPIRGALDGMQANQKWAATHPIHEAGVELFRVRKQGNLRKLHHKLMVIDEQVVIAGSFNYTNPANRLNDENIVILGDLDDNTSASVSKQKDLAAFALTEINRIINQFGEKVVT